jgi:hypothetical protein
MTNHGRLIRCTPLVLAAAFAASAARAEVEIAQWGDTTVYLGVDTVGTVQALDHENAFDATTLLELPPLDPGFQTAWGNLAFGATFGKEKEIEMFFDLLISSRNHPSTTYGHQGYLIVRGMPGDLKKVKMLDGIFRFVDVKIGHFHLDYGDNKFHRSDNADVASNPLIGNFIIDPELVDIGMEVSSKPAKFNWMVGVSNGTNTENVQENRGNAVHGKLWLDVAPFRVAVSAIRVDHSDNASTKAALFSGNRDGERYGGILGGGQAPGQILAQAGRDLNAWQADLTYRKNKVELYAHYGDTEDADTNGTLDGTPVEAWTYYTGEAVYRFTPKIHGAVRYSTAHAETFRDLDSRGKVDRIQIGGGYQLTDEMLIKLEYVRQEYDGFVEGDVLNNNIQGWRDPSFDGVLMEVSFAF